MHKYLLDNSVFSNGDIYDKIINGLSGLACESQKRS